MRLLSLPALFLLTILAFPALSQELPATLATTTGTIHGSLLIPEKVNRPPVVLIIAGSGPTDRDGNQQNLRNNSLKMLADSLRKNGIASLRYDKRGIAESEMEHLDPATLRFEHYVADAREWVSMLAADKRFSKVIVAGHSEGALIGLIAAINNPLVKGFISIAGAARPADELIKEQLAEQPQEIKTAVFPRLDTLKKGDTLRGVPQFLYALFNPAVQPYLISWMKYNPAEEVRKLKIPALVIQGTTDIQVLPKDAEMLKAAYPAASVAMVEKMNHILKEFPDTDKRAQVPTYSNPDLPLHPGLMQAVVPFIRSLR